MYVRLSLQLVAALELHEGLPPPGEDGDDGGRVDAGAVLEPEHAEVLEVGDEVAAARVDRRPGEVQILKNALRSRDATFLEGEFPEKMHNISLL